MTALMYNISRITSLIIVAKLIIEEHVTVIMLLPCFYCHAVDFPLLFFITWPLESTSMQQAPIPPVTQEEKCDYGWA